MFSRVLIANRGEVAVRLVRACHELGIEAVAVYSTADRDSLHVRLADEAVHIGPPPAAESYLNIPSLVAAGTTTGCEAVHPGWGFLAEKAEFAAACEDNDLVFVGPRPESIEAMGDKVRAKRSAAEAGLPLVPGSNGAATLEQARALAAEVGFPLLLKASAGGGGRGMRLVAGPDELESAFGTASSEAEAAFGDGSLYVERALVDARHVEIQVLGDGEGGVLTLGERDCSIQRRHQKLVEEGPSPAVSPELRAEMEEAARRATEALRYRGAGTIEFLLDADGRFYFIEMNTRLQVEHPVTELITGIDLAQSQFRIAAGEGLPQTGRAELRGHSIELPYQRRGPGARLPARARCRHALPAAARAGRSRRHPRRRRLHDPAVVRLPRRQGARLGRGPAGRGPPGAAGADRIRARGSAHDARAGDRHPGERAVHERDVHDRVHRGGRPDPPLAPWGGGMSSRRAARRTALELLYQWDLTAQPLVSLHDGEVDPFALELAEGVAAQAEELDARITAASDEWPADRLGVVERNVVRLGLYELERGDVPVEVAIDEAVSLAKRYASEDAGRLVNGILGRVAREAQQT